jgi:hypothetical protein
VRLVQVGVADEQIVKSIPLESTAPRDGSQASTDSRGKALVDRPPTL